MLSSCAPGIALLKVLQQQQVLHQGIHQQGRPFKRGRKAIVAVMGLHQVSELHALSGVIAEVLMA